MRHKSEHVDADDLMRFLDGELIARRKAEVRKHLDECWECRTRSMNIQSTIAEFINVHQQQFESVLPRFDAPRALLRARLHSMTNDSPPTRRPSRGLPYVPAVLSAAAMLTLLVVAFRFHAPSLNASVHDEPIAKLTPGESVVTTPEELCSSNSENGKRSNLLPSVKQTVFERYGMRHVRYQDFEVDYLITPELGGAASLRNLWPEPYAHTAWNARVKDQLEVRLYTLVCSHELSLPTAQAEIASDWIGAYRKYFRTDRPITQPQPMAAFFTVFTFPDNLPSAIAEDK